MKNKDYLQMLLSDNPDFCTKLVDILNIVSDFPDDMRIPEMKKVLTSGATLVSKIIDLQPELVDEKGIYKQLQLNKSNYYERVFPNGQIFSHSLYNFKVKPWEPSKKARAEYEKLCQEKAKYTVAEIKAMETQAEKKKEAIKLRFKKRKLAGKINMNSIKRISVPLYWQLQDLYGKGNKLPQNKSEAIALLFQKANKLAITISNNMTYEEGFGKRDTHKSLALGKILQKVLNSINARFLEYFSDAYVGDRFYYINASPDLNWMLNTSWVSIKPGMEQKFINSFENIMQREQKLNEEKGYCLLAYTQKEVLSAIIDTVLYSKNRIVRDDLAKGVKECAQLIDVISEYYVKEAIETNNPEHEKLTPYIHDLLIRMNMFDISDKGDKKETI